MLLLGDNQYERGAYAAYTSYFDPTWGRAKAEIAPAPGNHEYDNDPSSTPRGYFRYFGARREEDRTGSATTPSTSARVPTTRAGT